MFVQHKAWTSTAVNVPLLAGGTLFMAFCATLGFRRCCVHGSSVGGMMARCSQHDVRAQQYQ
jgi:hypothetical protein